MPRSDDLVLLILELTLRIRRLQSSLDGRIAPFLTDEEAGSLREALAAAQAEKAQLEEELRQLSGKGSS